MLFTPPPPKKKKKWGTHLPLLSLPSTKTPFKEYISLKRNVSSRIKPPILEKTIVQVWIIGKCLAHFMFTMHTLLGMPWWRVVHCRCIFSECGSNYAPIFPRSQYFRLFSLLSGVTPLWWPSKDPPMRQESFSVDCFSSSRIACTTLKSVIVRRKKTSS